MFIKDIESLYETISRCYVNAIGHYTKILQEHQKTPDLQNEIEQKICDLNVLLSETREELAKFKAIYNY